MAPRRPIRLPRHWPEHVKSSILHAISLPVSPCPTPWARHRARRLRAQVEQSSTEVALVREELDIKDGRWARRPPPQAALHTDQRMRILQLRAARGWTLEKTAEVFLVDLQT